MKPNHAAAASVPSESHSGIHSAARLRLALLEARAGLDRPAPVVALVHADRRREDERQAERAEEGHLARLGPQHVGVGEAARRSAGNRRPWSARGGSRRPRPNSPTSFASRTASRSRRRPRGARRRPGQRAMPRSISRRNAGKSCRASSACAPAPPTAKVSSGGAPLLVVGQRAEEVVELVAIRGCGRAARDRAAPAAPRGCASARSARGRRAVRAAAESR